MRREIRRAGSSYALALVSVDHFKTLHDRYGRDASDRVIKKIARDLRMVGRHARVFRYSGENFALVFPGKGRNEARSSTRCVRSGSWTAHPPRWWPRCATKRSTCAANGRCIVFCASEVPVQERRAQRTHPEYKKPELMATAPNQVWSWDITRLLGPKKWSYYYLYVIMDIYSRYVVGWMVADRENSALAGRLIQQSCLKHGVQPRLLTLHSDRGASNDEPMHRSTSR